MLCPKRSTSVKEHHSCHKQVSSILQQVKEDDLVLVAIDTKRPDSHCGCVVICMCNSFEIKKRGNTQSKTHKRCMTLFIPRPILRIPSGVGRAKTRIVQSSLGTHYATWPLSFSASSLEPKSLTNLHKKGKTKCCACETTTSESCLTCHNQKGKWKYWWTVVVRDKQTLFSSPWMTLPRKSM